MTNFRNALIVINDAEAQKYYLDGFLYRYLNALIKPMKSMEIIIIIIIKQMSPPRIELGALCV